MLTLAASLATQIAQAVFGLVALWLAVYVALELRLVWARRAAAPEASTSASAGIALDETPSVSVLLPVRNEPDTIERLIDAVSQLDYPDLEILVLDDSDDSETTARAKGRIAAQRDRGIDIRLIRRAAAQGYKAGNLMHGLAHARGELIAIFDADFAPPPDFLRRTVPAFSDDRLGLLQTAIGYENVDASLLARFQAREMSHQQYVTVGRSGDGTMASLTGSSCIWRRETIEALGGWNAETVTEDVDLAYRAQLAGWRYVWVPEVVSLSILPETARAFRVQRERWGRGLIQGAFRHVRTVFRQPMPLVDRLDALAMMFSSVLLASIHLLVIFGPALNGLSPAARAVTEPVVLSFYVLVAVWALTGIIGARRSGRDAGEPLWRAVAETWLHVALFLPMAWYYFVGGIRALAGAGGEAFHRTPKGASERSGPAPAINTVLLAGEWFTLAWSVASLLLAVYLGNLYLLPLHVTVCLGFALVLLYEYRDRRFITSRV